MSDDSTGKDFSGKDFSGKDSIKKDFSGKDSTGHDCSGHHDGHDRRKRRRRRRERLIRIGTISVDCSERSFQTPGQARNVLSCAVDQVVTVPVTQTFNVQVPTDFGCFFCVPVTQTVQVPVTTTVNVPPTLVPFPRIVCPPVLTQALCPRDC